MFDEEMPACPHTVEYVYVCTANIMKHDEVVDTVQHNGIHEIRVGATRIELIRRIREEIEKYWCDMHQEFPRAQIQARYTFLYLEKNVLE